MWVVLQAPINSDVRNFEYAQSSGGDVSDAESYDWMSIPEHLMKTDLMLMWRHKSGV